MTQTRVQSIYELAEQTGVSVSTVSRVLNQRGRISTETRRRVLAAARAAGFRPRMAARQVTVAVVLDRLRYAGTGGFVSSMLSQLIQAFARHDVVVEIYAEAGVSKLGTRFVDGVVGLSWDHATVDHLRQLQDVPVVVINRRDLEDLSTVATDHAEAGRMAASYLLGRGHSRIAFAAEELDWGAQQRLGGMRATLADAGHCHDDGLALFTHHHPLQGVLEDLLRQQPTALFLAGEDLTLEATFVLTEVLGVRIPQDISVIGLETANVSPFVRPPLTTLRQPLDELADSAIDLLLDRVQNGDSSPQHRLLRNELVERASVASL